MLSQEYLGRKCYTTASVWFDFSHSFILYLFMENRKSKNPQEISLLVSYSAPSCTCFTLQKLKMISKETVFCNVQLWFSLVLLLYKCLRNDIIQEDNAINDGALKYSQEEQIKSFSLKKQLVL